MAARLIVDRDLCIKAGECYFNHPELFKVEKDGFPVVLVQELSDDGSRAKAEAAADACPSQAIRVEG